MTDLLQAVLLTAAGTVPQWTPTAVGLLLVVIAACLFVVLWLVLDDEAAR